MVPATSSCEGFAPPALAVRSLGGRLTKSELVNLPNQPCLRSQHVVAEVTSTLPSMVIFITDISLRRDRIRRTFIMQNILFPKLESIK
jgi:hypothetical protein